MSEQPYLLDTSAVLTLIEDEAGAERVEALLRTTPVLLTWLTLLEVYYITYQERGPTEAERRYALLKVLPVTHLEIVNEPILLTAGRFKAERRLSLADALIAAYAAQYQAVLVHKDPEFVALAGEITLEALPYKLG